LRNDVRGLSSKDGFRGQYSYVALDTSPDKANTNFGTCAASRRPSHHRRARHHHARRRAAPRFTG